MSDIFVLDCACYDVNIIKSLKIDVMTNANYVLQLQEKFNHIVVLIEIYFKYAFWFLDKNVYIA
jgi:hypothetical protein